MKVCSRGDRMDRRPAGRVVRPYIPRIPASGPQDHASWAAPLGPDPGRLVPGEPFRRCPTPVGGPEVMAGVGRNRNGRSRSGRGRETCRSPRFDRPADRTLYRSPGALSRLQSQPAIAGDAIAEQRQPAVQNHVSKPSTALTMHVQRGSERKVAGHNLHWIGGTIFPTFQTVSRLRAKRLHYPRNRDRRCVWRNWRISR